MCLCTAPPGSETDGVKVGGRGPMVMPGLGFNPSKARSMLKTVPVSGRITCFPLHV